MASHETYKVSVTEAYTVSIEVRGRARLVVVVVTVVLANTVTVVAAAAMAGSRFSTTGLENRLGVPQMLTQETVHLLHRPCVTDWNWLPQLCIKNKQPRLRMMSTT